MGQPLRVVAEREIAPDVVRLELDRSITGTGHETYSSQPEGEGTRPCDVLAFRLFESGTVARVHCFSNMVEVTVTGADIKAQLLNMRDVVQKLFTHYLPGVEPTPIATTPSATA